MIRLVNAYSYEDEVKELFSEYTAMLIEGDSQFKEYLEEAQDAYEVESISELYPNKGTDRHLRMYAEIQNNRKKREAEK